MGKDALKFAKNFQVSIDNNDTTTVGTSEDWYPLGVILQSYGKSVKDYPSTDDALAAVRHLCEQNRAEHGYEEKPEQLDEKFPEFSRFWFVMSLGKKKENQQNVQKKLSQQVDLKNMGQLEQAKCFMEGLGWKDEEAGTSSVKIENAKAGDLKKTVELLKFSYLGSPFVGGG